MEGSASARWMTCLGFRKRYDHVAKSELRQNFAKVAEILRLLQNVFENKFGQVVEKPSDLILCLFGFVKATKFRDSSEYSQCVQNVLAKSCLPCQILHKPKKFLAERGKG